MFNHSNHSNNDNLTTNLSNPHHHLFNNQKTGRFRSNTAPSSIVVTISPTHSIYLTEQKQKQQTKRRKRRVQKHLRQPQSFDTYLHSRSNSISSISSCDSSIMSLNSPSTLVFHYPNHINNSTDYSTSPSSSSSSSSSSPPSPSSIEQHSVPSFISSSTEILRRVSSAIRLSNLLETFSDDGNSSIASTMCSRNNSDDEWDPKDDESEEEFLFINSKSVI